jgi:hypothetical protein
LLLLFSDWSCPRIACEEFYGPGHPILGLYAQPITRVLSRCAVIQDLGSDRLNSLR